MVKPLADRSMAVGLFNLGEIEREMTVPWSELGISGEQSARDLWRQKDLGTFETAFTTKIPRHGVTLLRVAPTQ
jgi:alpha-galactosidase